MFVVLNAGVPVADWTLAHFPRRYPDPSRFLSCTDAYSLIGTAASESFMSVRLWLPLDWTGLTLKTVPVPVADPLPGLSAEAGCAVATVTRAAARTAVPARAEVVRVIRRRRLVAIRAVSWLGVGEQTPQTPEPSRKAPGRPYLPDRVDWT